MTNLPTIHQCLIFFYLKTFEAAISFPFSISIIFYKTYFTGLIFKKIVIISILSINNYSLILAIK